MKKGLKIVGIVLIVLVLFWVVHCGVVLYRYAPLGDGLTHVLLPSLPGDLFTAREIMEQADQAFGFIGNREEAEREFGLLARYSQTNPGTVREGHRLCLLAANFDGDAGEIWVGYEREGYDADGMITCGSWGIVSHWIVERLDDMWTVAEIQEAP